MGWTATDLTADVLELIASGTPASTEAIAGHAVQHVADKSSFNHDIITAELSLQYLAGYNPARGTAEIVKMASRLAGPYTKQANSTTDPWLEGALNKAAIACYQEALASLAGVDIKDGKKVATNRIPASARIAGAIMMPGAVEAVLADILIRATESMERSNLTDHLVADFMKEGLSHLAGYTGNAGLEIIAREGVKQIDRELDASTEALIKGFPNSHGYKKKAVTRGKIALDNILNYRDNPSYSKSGWRTDGNSERKVIIEENTDVIIDGLRLKKNAMM